ncbi:MAG TPA: hypothetical protein VGL77_15050 [Armatimonadota bacterium]
MDYSIEVHVDPMRVNYVPNTPNRVIIRVMVRKSDGTPAPNFTPVRFNTTLGTIVAQANTQNGQVVVPLENMQGPGRATVEIIASSSRQVVYIEFLGPGGSAGDTKAGRLCYRLRAKQCYFSPEKRIFDLRDQAEFVTPQCTVTAGAIQYSVRTQLLTAQHDVTLKVGNQSVTGEKLRLDLSARQGALVQVSPEIAYKSFTLAQFDPKVDESAKTLDFRPLDPAPTKTWIISKRARIYPNDQIQFQHVEFYLDKIDKCILRLPYHVLDLRSSNANTFLNTDISLTSDAGLNVDFPAYYAANDNHIGAIHLRNVTPGSSLYRGTSGFQLGIEEEYQTGNSGIGTLYLDDLAQPTRSATWAHQHNYGRTSVTVGASLDRYSPDTPYSSRANLAVARPIGTVGMNFSTNVTAFDGAQQGLAELSANMPLLKLWHTGTGITFNPYVGFRGSFTPASASGTTSSTPSTAEKQDRTLYEGLHSGLLIPVIPKVLGGTINTDLSHEISHDSHGTLANYLDAGIHYQRRLIPGFIGVLGYTYSLASSTADTTAQKPGQHITLEMSGNRPNLTLFGNSTYNMSDKSVYSSVSSLYYLPWNRARSGERRLFMEYTASFTSQKDSPISADHFFTLGRPIGSYTLQLHYSPTGNNNVTGIGTGTGKRWAFELVREGW